MGDAAVLGIDVGGTAVKAVRIGADGTTWLPSVATPRQDPSAAATVAVIAELVAAAEPVAAVGVAVPGVVDERAGVCALSVNLGWRDLPVRDLVAARVRRPEIGRAHV